MEDLMEEAKPVFDHASMVKTVAEVLATASDELGPEDKTSLLASVTDPKPKPDDWGVFAQLLVKEGLPDAAWTCLQQTRDDGDVALFALHALSTWLEKEDERLTAEIHALRNLPGTLLDVSVQHSKNIILLSKSVGIFLTIPDDLLTDKERTPKLASRMLDLIDTAHQHGTHGIWQYMSAAVARLMSIITFKAEEWGTMDAILDIVHRLLRTVERNAGHWECFYLLQVLLSFRVVLSQDRKLTVDACSKVILAHTQNGTECTDRKLCDPGYEQAVGWGSTLDVALNILQSMCFFVNCFSQNHQALVSTAARAMHNCYVPGRKYEADARKFLDMPAVETMCGGSVVRACIELILSHPDYRRLKAKAIQLLLVMTYDKEHFRIDDLYRNGAGAFTLLEIISSPVTGGLGNKEAADADLMYISNAAALLMMMTGERRYKMGILGRGYEQLWSLIQAPDTVQLGLTALCYLSMNSPDAQEWLRKRGTDKKLMDMFREPMDLVRFKMTLDVLSEMQSPEMQRLPEVLGTFDQMISVAFYYTPRLSDTEMTRDNSLVVCSILKCITQSLNDADRRSEAEGNRLALSLADAGYAFLLVQILWWLDPEHPIWKEAAVAGFYFFRWNSDTSLETVGKWVLHVRRTAEDLDPNAKHFRKVLERNPDIERETFDGPRNSFWEALYLQGMMKRKIVASNKHAEAPRNDLVVMQKAKEADKRPSAVEVALSMGDKACSYCGSVPGAKMGQRLQRCARCKKAWYCTRSCQKNHWTTGHKDECVKID